MKISNLEKIIDGRTIVEAINFEIQQDEIVGLVGRNGSGKTTIFRTLAGNYLPDNGDIEIDGTSLLSDESKKSELFYIDESDNFLRSYSLQKINAFYRLAYPKFNQELYLELMREHQLPLQLHYRRMSKGMQGLYQMILAICSNATYLLLDEPFDGLDVIVRKKVIGLLLEHLADNHRCALIASHNLKELEGLVDRALVIKGKTIAKDYRLEDTRENARKIQMVFKSKQVPQVVKENSKLVATQGRVIIAIFENFTPEIETKIKAADPILFEELPLSLEDLFEANLRQENLIR